MMASRIVFPPFVHSSRRPFDLIDFARGAFGDCHSMDKSSFAVNIASHQDAVRVIDHGDFEEIHQIRI